MVRIAIILLLTAFNVVPVLLISDYPSQNLTKLSIRRCSVFEAIQDAEYYISTPSLNEENNCNKNGGVYFIDNENVIEDATAINETGRCIFPTKVDLESNLIILPDEEFCQYNTGYCTVKDRLVTWKVEGFLTNYIYSGVLDLWQLESTELEFNVTILAHQNITFNLVVKRALNQEFWSTSENGIYIKNLPDNDSEPNKWNVTLFNKYFGPMKNRTNMIKDDSQILVKLSSKKYRMSNEFNVGRYYLTLPVTVEDKESCEKTLGTFDDYNSDPKIINGTKIYGECSYLFRMDLEKNITRFPNGVYCTYNLEHCSINGYNVSWHAPYLSNTMYIGYLDIWKLQNARLELDLTVLLHQNITLNLIMKKVFKYVGEDFWGTIVDGIYMQKPTSLDPDSFDFNKNIFEQYFGEMKYRKVPVHAQLL